MVDLFKNCANRSLLLFILLFSKVKRFYTLDNVSKEDKIPYKFVLEPTLPGMVVFNVDELLWPFEVDKVMTPPLRTTSVKRQIRDRMGKLFELFPETAAILEDLFTHWYKLGGLVQSTDPEKIENIMNLFDIDRFFKFFEVFPRTPGCKVKHLKRISERAAVPLEDILYFDTSKEDLDAAKALNVTTILVDSKEGITYTDVLRGFEVYYYVKNYTLAYHYQGVLTVTAQSVDELFS